MVSIVDSRWTLFTHVAELGGFTNAAAALDMPQSVLSRNIRALERECGARLFRRTGRGVVLTDFGQQIYPRIKQLIAQADPGARSVDPALIAYVVPSRDRHCGFTVVNRAGVQRLFARADIAVCFGATAISLNIPCCGSKVEG